MKKIFTLIAIVLSATIFGNRSFAAPLLEVYSSANSSVGMNFTIGCTLAEVTYELQRSSDNIHYTTFYTATVTQSRCGTPFSYSDNNPIRGICYYRYKLTNLDGEAGFSNIAAVKLSGSEKIKVVPTLAMNAVSVFYNATVAGNSNWVLYDMNGRVIAKQAFKLQRGQNEIVFDVRSLNRGRYQIQGITPEEKTEATAVIKQ